MQASENMALRCSSVAMSLASLEGMRSLRCGKDLSRPVAVDEGT